MDFIEFKHKHYLNLNYQNKRGKIYEFFIYKGLAYKVHFSTFHPQTDAQVECSIPTLEDMAHVIDFKGN